MPYIPWVWGFGAFHWLVHNWLPFLKTLMVFIRLEENIRWALRNCPIIPCRLLDWYVLITSFEILGKREVLHFHPAVGGGISCLDRAVVKLYFTEMFFTLLSSKAGSSLNGSNLCNNSLLVPEALSLRLLQSSPKFFVLSDSRQSSFMTFFTAAKAILGESSFTFPAIFFHFRPAKLITSARLPRYEIRQWFMFCLVPVPRFPSLSRSIRFGDVSEAHGPRDPKRFGHEEKWGLGTRQVYVIACLSVHNALLKGNTSLLSKSHTKSLMK